MNTLKQVNITDREISSSGKDSPISLEQIHDLQGSDGFVSHAYVPTAQNAETTTLRRLFNFVQLLAFSLTFMESWEVMAM